MFWDTTVCSPLKVNQRFEEHVATIFRFEEQAKQEASMNLLATCFILVSCSAYSSTLKMKATSSSETLVHSQRTTRRYITEDRTLHNPRCENVKSYKNI
jgi:hypothetical protein